VVLTVNIHYSVKLCTPSQSCQLQEFWGSCPGLHHVLRAVRVRLRFTLPVVCLDPHRDVAGLFSMLSIFSSRIYKVFSGETQWEDTASNSWVAQRVWLENKEARWRNHRGTYWGDAKMAWGATCCPKGTRGLRGTERNTSSERRSLCKVAAGRLSFINCHNISLRKLLHNWVIVVVFHRHVHRHVEGQVLKPKKREPIAKMIYLLITVTWSEQVIGCYATPETHCVVRRHESWTKWLVFYHNYNLFSFTKW